MTPALMQSRTRQQLAALDTETKAELMAFVNNRMTPVICYAELIFCGESKDVQGSAKIVTREGRLFLKELNALLERNPNNHLGTTKE